MSAGASSSRRGSCSGRSSSRRRCRRSSSGFRLGLIFALINVVGVEFLINFGGLGQLINDLAERYDLAGTYAAICFVILVSVLFFIVIGKGRAMAETGRTERIARRPRRCVSPVTLVRIAIIADGPGRLGSSRRIRACSIATWCRRCWRSARRSGGCSSTRDFYWHLGVTAGEVGAALAIGGTGAARGRPRSRRQQFLSQRLRTLSLLSRPDAEDHLLPDHDHVVRRRPAAPRSRSARCPASSRSRCRRPPACAQIERC